MAKLRGNLLVEDIDRMVSEREYTKGKSDGNGLTFRVSRKGKASWSLRYRFNGRPRFLPLGRYPAISLDAARRAAVQAWAQIYKGVDVALERRKERFAANKAMLFRDLFEDYLQRTGKKLSPESQLERRRFLKKDLGFRLGHLVARDIAPEDIIATVEDIAKRSDPVARHAFCFLSVVFDHGVAKRAVPMNPCRGLKLTAILGDRPKQRERLKLTRDELRAVLTNAPALGRIASLAVKIILGTCVRKSELLHAKKAEIDLEAGQWTVRAKRTRKHVREGIDNVFIVPIAPTVAGWFRELIALSGDSEWLLPAQFGRARREGGHAGKSGLNSALKRARGHLTGVRAFSPHDLRSTARSHLAELGVDRFVAERCLNHSLKGMEGIYDKHDYMDERRRALELWANLLVELETGKAQNVVALRPAA